MGEFLFCNSDTEYYLNPKDDLTKELATKEDIAKLEGEIQTMKVTLDRKFTVMFLILLFTTIFVNQNSLVLIAKLLGLAK